MKYYRIAATMLLSLAATMLLSLAALLVIVVRESVSVVDTAVFASILLVGMGTIVVLVVTSLREDAEAEIHKIDA